MVAAHRGCFAGSISSDCHVGAAMEERRGLVDWTGRAVRRDKRGNIHASLPPILHPLSIDMGIKKLGLLFGTARLDDQMKLPNQQLNGRELRCTKGSHVVEKHCTRMTHSVITHYAERSGVAHGWLR
jgi:hypothetical protein